MHNNKNKNISFLTLPKKSATKVVATLAMYFFICLIVNNLSDDNQLPDI
ncbi:hypothetical protein SALWKB2_1535 [Snodgrassella alvi wkB2]|nr:hypothetical protein SALWKB2_1535 [Snodgrassella alvi wkB2]